MKGVLLLCVACLAYGVIAASPVQVQVAFMSKCPDTVSFEQTFFPVVKDLSSIMSFDLLAVAAVESDGSLSSRHGASEVEGDLYEVCAMAHNNLTVFYEFLMCVGQQWTRLPAGIDKCAESTPGVDADRLKVCATGEEGKQLLRQSIGKMSSICPGRCWAPTVWVDGRKVCEWHADCELKSAEAFTQYICSQYQGTTKPPACHP